MQAKVTRKPPGMPKVASSGRERRIPPDYPGNAVAGLTGPSGRKPLHPNIGQSPRARRDVTDAALIAAASEYPDGSAIVLAEISRAVERHPNSVRQTIRRLQAEGRWRWAHGEVRPVPPKPPSKPRPKPKPITTGHGHTGVRVPPTPTGRVSMAGNPAMAKCVLVHGWKVKSLDPKEAENDVAALLRAYRSRSRAEFHKAAFKGAR